jgi:hypothetical protein
VVATDHSSCTPLRRYRKVCGVSSFFFFLISSDVLFRDLLLCLLALVSSLLLLSTVLFLKYFGLYSTVSRSCFFLS